MSRVNLDYRETAINRLCEIFQRHLEDTEKYLSRVRFEPPEPLGREAEILYERTRSLNVAVQAMRSEFLDECKKAAVI